MDALDGKMPNDKVIDECPVCHYKDDSPKKYEFLEERSREYGFIKLICPQCGVAHVPQSEFDRKQDEKEMGIPFSG